MDTAPRGTLILKKHPKSGHEYEQHQPVAILGSKGDYVTETYWIPAGHPEGGKNGRWHRFNQGVELDGWDNMPAPMKPK